MLTGSFTVASASRLVLSLFDANEFWKAALALFATLVFATLTAVFLLIPGDTWKHALKQALAPLVRLLLFEPSMALRSIALLAHVGLFVAPIALLAMIRWKAEEAQDPRRSALLILTPALLFSLAVVGLLITLLFVSARRYIRVSEEFHQQVRHVLDPADFFTDSFQKRIAIICEALYNGFVALQAPGSGHREPVLVAVTFHVVDPARNRLVARCAYSENRHAQERLKAAVRDGTYSLPLVEYRESESRTVPASLAAWVALFGEQLDSDVLNSRELVTARLWTDKNRPTPDAPWVNDLHGLIDDQSADHFKPRSYVAVPVIPKPTGTPEPDYRIGVLGAVASHPRYFTSFHLRLLLRGVRLLSRLCLDQIPPITMEGIGAALRVARAECDATVQQEEDHRALRRRMRSLGDFVARNGDVEISSEPIGVVSLGGGSAISAWLFHAILTQGEETLSPIQFLADAQESGVGYEIDYRLVMSHLRCLHKLSHAPVTIVPIEVPSLLNRRFLALLKHCQHIRAAQERMIRPVFQLRASAVSAATKDERRRLKRVAKLAQRNAGFALAVDAPMNPDDVSRLSDLVQAEYVSLPALPQFGVLASQVVSTLGDIRVIVARVEDARTVQDVPWSSCWAGFGTALRN